MRRESTFVSGRYPGCRFSLVAAASPSLSSSATGRTRSADPSSAGSWASGGSRSWESCDGGSLAKAWLDVVVVVAAAAAVGVVATTVEVEKAVIVAGVEAWVCVDSLIPSENVFKI